MLYRDFSPTGFDTPGAFLDSERQDWIVAPVMQTRDSGPLESSNFATVRADLERLSDEVEVHRFGHWGPGWFEIIICPPTETLAAAVTDWERALEDYPVADDEDFSARELEAAQETWSNCYDDSERLDYIRRHRSQFEFTDFADLWACVKGQYFCGYASELITP